MNDRHEQTRMLVDEIDDGVDAETLVRQYRSTLAEIVADVGVDAAASETGIDADRLDSLDEPGSALTLDEATSILALEDDRTPEAIRRDVGDHLMLQMSSAVVDVDALSSALGGDLGPRDYQQMIEGRMTMPLAEYARIYRYVSSKNPY